MLGRGAQQKISALEGELQRLREQIAMIVTAPAGTVCSESGSNITDRLLQNQRPNSQRSDCTLLIILYICHSSVSGPAPLSADLSTPCSTPLRTPILTSTPMCPPPPPPPLPPLSVGNSREVSVTEVIRQRQAAKQEKAEQMGPSVDAASAVLPSMLEVLRDLNQVKLRTVERYTYT